jgi:hypothetical protein
MNTHGRAGDIEQPDRPTHDALLPGDDCEVPTYTRRNRRARLHPRAIERLLA